VPLAQTPGNEDPNCGEADVKNIVFWAARPQGYWHSGETGRTPVDLLTFQASDRRKEHSDCTLQRIHGRLRGRSSASHS
jgi:hypothetical protein